MHRGAGGGGVATRRDKRWDDNAINAYNRSSRDISWVNVVALKWQRCPLMRHIDSVQHSAVPLSLAR